MCLCVCVCARTISQSKWHLERQLGLSHAVRWEVGGVGKQNAFRSISTRRGRGTPCLELHFVGETSKVKAKDSCCRQRYTETPISTQFGSPAFDVGANSRPYKAATFHCLEGGGSAGGLQGGLQGGLEDFYAADYFFQLMLKLDFFSHTI